MKKGNIFIVSLILAIWCVVLFYGKKIGLSMLLFIIPITYYLIFILEKNNKIENNKAKILLIPIILLASTYLIYDNHFFNNLNLIVIPLLIIIMLVSLFTNVFNLEVWIEKAVELVFDPIAYLGETLKKIKLSILRKFKLKSKDNNNSKKVFKGLLITIPIALIIIGMLASADQEFSSVLYSIIRVIGKAFVNMQFMEIALRLLLIIIVFIYLSSFFDNIISKFKVEKEDKEDDGL